MNIGDVEQIIEPGKRLQRQQGYVGSMGYKRLKLGAEGSVAAEEEVNAGIVLERFRKRREELKPLLGPHVAGIEDDDLSF